MPHFADSQEGSLGEVHQQEGPYPSPPPAPRKHTIRPPMPERSLKKLRRKLFEEGNDDDDTSPEQPTCQRLQPSV